MTDITKITLDDVLDMLADKVAARINGAVEDKPATTKAKTTTKSKAKAEPEPDEDETGEEEAEAFDRDAREAELKKSRITTLRKQAAALGYSDDEVKDASKEDIISGILDAEEEDAAKAAGDDEPVNEDDDDAADEAEADEESDEDEDEEGEGDEYTRDDLEAMSLADLKGIAKEYEYKASELRGLSKDDLVDLLLGEDEEDEEEAEDEDEGDDEAYTEEELQEMSLAELKSLCKTYEIKVPRGAKQDDLIALLMEEDDEEE